MSFSMLWISTQDNQSLINVKEVTVNGKKIKGFVSSSTLDEWSKDLGKYESKERALEVLNEIFMKIEENNGISATFAMPKK
ncbi:hypothetical protein FITA111629_07645 [Filibacter tadaridae]|uniref:Uncharacterized protein n=2 Tax=Filibacter tadaridae TaxID=2483811 RepID=A0A3P5XHK2_9BACL|nr:hypothetical protein [Filibacter tadaridae]VDC28185.1 hypothetical protein FILTAD_01802 [Filibacter tadaridae]